MRRALVTLGFVVALMGFARPAHAQATGSALGIEVCPQSECGAAVFYGAVQLNAGTIGGTLLGAIQHEELPEVGAWANLTLGWLQLLIGPGLATFDLTSGALFNIGDGTFYVLAAFSNGATVLVFEGILNHNFFPPLIYGTLTAFPIPD